MTKPKPNRQQIIYTRICVQCGQSFRPGKNGSEWNAIYCNFCLDDPRSTLATKKAPPSGVPEGPSQKKVADVMAVNPKPS